MTYGLTNSQYYSDIADAIRAKRPDLPLNTTFTPSEMANAIMGISNVDPETYEWERPAAWPDLDSVYDDEENTLLMSIDATGRIYDPHFCITVGTNNDDVSLPSSSYTVEIGEIQNGVFIVSETQIMENETKFTKVFTSSSNYYPVIRISSLHLRKCKFESWTSSENRVYLDQDQPIIEVIGHCEYGQYDYRTCYYTERENITIDIASGRYLQNRWKNAFCLKKLEFGNSDTGSWGVKRMDNTWQNCYSLISLDLSNWETSKWDQQGDGNSYLSSTWNNCCSLRKLNLKGFGSSAMKSCINLSGTWSNCYSLKELDVSDWDVSNWAVTNMTSTWSNCYSLKELDVSDWDISNWAVTAIPYTWQNCRALEKLDLSDWDVSNWAVTNMSNTWFGCYSLKELDISNWDVSNWRVSNDGIQFTWSECINLKAMDLSNWDTSGFNISGKQIKFENCRTIKIIDLSSIDMSKITCLNLNYNYLLETLIFGSNNNNKFLPTINSIATNANATPNMLSHQSIINLFNALADGGNVTIMIGTNNLNKLTSAEKAIATNKGYTLA